MEFLNIKEYVKREKLKMAAERNLLSKDLLNREFLAIVQVGNNPASDAYIKGKRKDAAEINLQTRLYPFETDITEKELLRQIATISKYDSCVGIIVQLPLPKQIDPKRVAMAISPSLDVDGFRRDSLHRPCTPLGIMNYLKACDFNFRGKNALVIGRSNIVGKPMAEMLVEASCTVAIANSATTTETLLGLVSKADLIVCAVGKEHFLNANMRYKPSAVLVDVGINRGIDGKLHGDADPGLPVAHQTPVPGGVGLLTRLQLMENCLDRQPLTLPVE